MARETWIHSQIESYQRLKKWYLMPPCLTLSIIRYGSRVKWSNPRKGVAPFPTPWCSSYRKGSHNWRDNGISLKVNVIMQLEFELTKMSQSSRFATKSRCLRLSKQLDFVTMPQECIYPITPPQGDFFSRVKFVLIFLLLYWLVWKPSLFFC